MWERWGGRLQALTRAGVCAAQYLIGSLPQSFKVNKWDYASVGEVVEVIRVNLAVHQVKVRFIHRPKGNGGFDECYVPRMVYEAWFDGTPARVGALGWGAGLVQRCWVVAAGGWAKPALGRRRRRSGAGREASYFPAAGNTVTVQSFPLKYFWARTIMLSQGLEFENLWVHAERIFDYNQFYTAVTRARGSPADGRLRITGIGCRAELAEKARMHPKALLLMHRLGRAVQPQVVEAAAAWVAEHEERWAVE